MNSDQEAYIPAKVERELEGRRHDRGSALIALKKRLKFLIWEAVADDLRGASDWDTLEEVLNSILIEVHHNRVIGFNIPPKK